MPLEKKTALTENGRGGKRQTTAKVAAPSETLTSLEPIQLSLFDLDSCGKKSSPP